MFKRLKAIWNRDLIRPLIHRSFTRLIWGLFFSLLLAFFVEQGSGRDLRGLFLLLYGLLCLLGAWLSYLQLDGASLPRLDRLRAKYIDRKRPKRQTGDMIDFVDEEMETYEELEDEERYLVLFLADLALFLLFLIFSWIVSLL